MSPIMTATPAPEPHTPSWCTIDHAIEHLTGHQAHVGQVQVKADCWMSVAVFQKGAGHRAEVVVVYADVAADGRIPTLFLAPASVEDLAVMQEALGHADLAGLLRKAAELIEASS